MLKIENTTERFYTAAGVTLKPGVNKIDNEKLEKGFMAHPHVKLKLKKGSLKLMEGKAAEEDDAGDENPGEINFETATAKDIIAWIKDATAEDGDKLNELAEDERSTVKEAATKKLEELTAE